MEKCAYSPILKEDINKVQEIVKDLTKRKMPNRAQRVPKNLFEKVYVSTLILIVVGLVIFLALAFLNHIYNSHPLAEAKLALSIYIILLVFILIVLIIVLFLSLLRNIYRHPFAPQFEILEDAIAMDLTKVLELTEYNREAVEYVLAHYRHLRLAFEKRVLRLAGPIEKVGFFPATFAFAILISHNWTQLNAWLRDLSFTVPIFYFISWLIHMLIDKMDRAITLIEYSLVARDRSDLLTKQS